MQQALKNLDKKRADEKLLVSEMKGFIRVRMMSLANDFPLDCSPSTMTCNTMADFSP